MKKKHTFYFNPTPEGFNWEQLANLKRLPALIAKWGRCKATFEKYVPKKSLKQLGYYRSGILPYLEKQHYESTGWVAQDWHNNLKEQFGGKKYSACGRFMTVVSHADYTEKQMSDFITKVRDFSVHTLQDEIPNPLHIEDYL